MGLFSSKKITYVDSVAYNMAGDEAERPNYLKALVLQHTTSGSKRGISESLQSGYINGPQFNFRAFYRWCKDNYTTVGMPDAAINGFVNINNTTIIDQLPARPGYAKYLQNAEVIDADYTSWAEQWVLANRPDQYSTEYASLLQDDGTLLIEFVDGTSVTFVPPNFDKDANYIYILYNYVKENESQPKVTGETITLDNGQPWPDTNEWAMDYDNVSNPAYPLNRTTTVTKSYSDGRPDETTSSTVATPETYQQRDAHYYMYENDGAGSNLTSRKYDRYFVTTTNVTVKTTSNTVVADEGGVIVTTKTTVNQDELNMVRTHRTDYQDTIVSEWTDKTLWLYKIGSGNIALDNMIANPVRIAGEFFPPMPVRIENKFISETFMKPVYDQTKKAYKKAMNRQSFDELIEKVADNKSLKDIDFAFVVFGVSLNVKENACKKYLYEFFLKLKENQRYGSYDFDEFQAKLDAYKEAINVYRDYIKSHENTNYEENPATPPPKLPPDLPSPKINNLQVKARGTVNIPYNIVLQWCNIVESTHPGLGKVGAKKGELWFEVRPKQSWSPYMINRGNNREESWIDLLATDTYNLENCRLYWQVSETEHKRLDISGLRHVNRVYNGKNVNIGSTEALQDKDESGFIVPMHYDTMKKISLVASTQMTTASCFIVFNCYVVKKQKWYQRGIFKILFVIVFAIVSAIFTGGAGFGLLGANITVGASLGFTGLAAAIVGSVVNALAAVILTQIISKVSVVIFGEQFGALIGAILTFIAFNVAINFQMNGVFGIDWGAMMRAENLLKLTDAASQGYAGYMQGVIKGIGQDIGNLQTSYENRSEEIANLWGKNIGYSDIMFNPAWVTQSNITYNFEGASSFLTRTLMTGTDIANMSHDMLTDYTDLNLTLPSVYG